MERRDICSTCAKDITYDLQLINLASGRHFCHNGVCVNKVYLYMAIDPFLSFLSALSTAWDIGSFEGYGEVMKHVEAIQ